MNCIFTIPTFVSAAIFLFVFFCYFLEGEGNCLHKVLLSILSIFTPLLTSIHMLSQTAFYFFKFAGQFFIWIGVVVFIPFVTRHAHS